MAEAQLSFFSSHSLIHFGRMIPRANFLFPEGLQKEKSLHHLTFQFAYPALFACILKTSSRRKKKKGEDQIIIKNHGAHIQVS